MLFRQLHHPSWTNELLHRSREWRTLYMESAVCGRSVPPGEFTTERLCDIKLSHSLDLVVSHGASTLIVYPRTRCIHTRYCIFHAPAETINRASRVRGIRLCRPCKMRHASGSVLLCLDTRCRVRHQPSALILSTWSRSRVPSACASFDDPCSIYLYIPFTGKKKDSTLDTSFFFI